jgi:hypothetical protein
LLLLLLSLLSLLSFLCDDSFLPETYSWNQSGIVARSLG